MLVFEEAGGAVAIAALALLHHFADESFVDWVASDGLVRWMSVNVGVQWMGSDTNLHHGKMLCAVVSLEQSIAGPALD
jgi:hypothetical protein